MNGPEHYTAAEHLLAEGEAVVAEIREVRAEARRDALGKQAHGIWLQAQAHATLALAAAQADQVVADALSRPNWVNTSAWEVAIQSTKTTEGAPF